VSFLERGKFSVELFEREGSEPLPEDRRMPNLDICTHGTKHIAYVVKDLNKSIAKLKSQNADIAMDIFHMQGSLVASIRDNAGNLIELI
jgi:methylmalonyl-CoA/ethylmalonyl-CoA epimerase